MQRAIGVTTAERVVTGVVEDHKLAGSLHIWPEGGTGEELLGMPVDAIARRLADEIVGAA